MSIISTTITDNDTAVVAYAVETPFQRILHDFAASRLALAAFVVLTIMIIIALFAPWIAPQNPYDLSQLDIFDGTLPPLSRGGTGMLYLLGTDAQGRDMLSGIMYGLRTSLFVGVFAGLIAFVAGTSLGLLAAYFRGWFDTVLMRLVDLQLSFPAMLIALMLLAILGQGVDKIVIALIVVQWSYYARAARAAALAERNKEYVEAARCQVFSAPRIIFRHIMPNSMAPLIVIVTVQVAHAITLEATLSFLGLGLPITEPSLGLLISNGYNYLLSGMYWISFYPGIALVTTIVSINLVGDHLRDILNPRLQK